MNFLERALELAERGRGTTQPNPVVGAVLVRDGEIVGEGWHERKGEPHAEANALVVAGDRARGSTLYVTLEPCASWGSTPPCAQAVIDAGVARAAAGGRRARARFGTARGGVATFGRRGDPVAAARGWADAGEVVPAGGRDRQAARLRRPQALGRRADAVRRTRRAGRAEASRGALRRGRRASDRLSQRALRPRALRLDRGGRPGTVKRKSRAPLKGSRARASPPGWWLVPPATRGERIAEIRTGV